MTAHCFSEVSIDQQVLQHLQPGEAAFQLAYAGAHEGIGFVQHKHGGERRKGIDRRLLPYLRSSPHPYDFFCSRRQVSKPISFQAFKLRMFCS